MPVQSEEKEGLSASASLNTVDPSPLNDPAAYLSLFKFNRKLRCSRTGSDVSFSDIGDPSGTPVLMIPPSGCTRWFAAPQGKQSRLWILTFRSARRWP